MCLFVAIICCGAGAILGLFGEVLSNPDSQKLTLENYLGFLVALVTTIFFAIYLVLIQMVTRLSLQFPRELIVWWHMMSMAVVGAILAPIFEDWCVTVLLY